MAGADRLFLLEEREGSREYLELDIPYQRLQQTFAVCAMQPAARTAWALRDILSVRRRLSIVQRRGKRAGGKSFLETQNREPTNHEMPWGSWLGGGSRTPG